MRYSIKYGRLKSVLLSRFGELLWNSKEEIAFEILQTQGFRHGID